MRDGGAPGDGLLVIYNMYHPRTTCGKQERIDPTDRLEILHWSTFRPFVGLFSSSVSIRVAVPSPL